jgi:collagen type VII alpha
MRMISYKLIILALLLTSSLGLAYGQTVQTGSNVDGTSIASGTARDTTTMGAVGPVVGTAATTDGTVVKKTIGANRTNFTDINRTARTNIASANTAVGTVGANAAGVGVANASVMGKAGTATTQTGGLAAGAGATSNSGVGTTGVTGTTGATGVTGTTGVTGAAGIVPSVVVSDQRLVGSSLIVSRVVSDGPGWVVIHNNLQGRPGGMIGFSHVNDGINNDVSVTIDPKLATASLFAELHRDLGTLGSFEYPGPDVEVMVNGVPVMASFTISLGTGTATALGQAQTTATAQAGTTGTTGQPLRIGQGETVKSTSLLGTTNTGTISYAGSSLPSTTVTDGTIVPVGATGTVVPSTTVTTGPDGTVTSVPGGTVTTTPDGTITTLPGGTVTAIPGGTVITGPGTTTTTTSPTGTSTVSIY